MEVYVFFPIIRDASLVLALKCAMSDLKLQGRLLFLPITRFEEIARMADIIFIS